MNDRYQPSRIRRALPIVLLHGYPHGMGNARETIDISNVECPKGYEQLKLPFNLGGQRLAYSDPVEYPNGLVLKLYGNIKDKSLRGYARCGAIMEGPPGHVHGGIMAYILDETMGSAAWNLGKPVVAEQIEVKYLRMLRQNEVFSVDAKMSRIDDERVYVEGCLSDMKGRPYCTASGRFHILTPAQLQGIATQANIELPEWLKKF